jgi:hypothetical protein
MAQGNGWKAEIKGTTLTITVDLKNEAGESGSGKSAMIAKTGGNVDIGDGTMMGLSVYRKIKK